MKFRDCVYYSQKMNIGKKHETGNTVAGFFISLITLSILLVFGSLMLYLETSMNEEHNLSSCLLNVAPDNSAFIEQNSEYVDEKIRYSSYGYGFNRIADGFLTKEVIYPTITIDGIETVYQDSYEYDTDTPVKITGQSFSAFEDEKLYLDSEREYLLKHNLGDLILAGNSLTGNKNEIMVSSYLLDYFGIENYDEVIGKKISCYNQLSFSEKCYGHVENGEYIDETDSVKNKYYYVFKDFTIVGVFNSNIYLCPSRYIDDGQAYPEYLIKTGAAYWVSSESVKCYPYSYYTYTDDSGKIHTSQNKLCFDVNLPDELSKNTDKIQIIQNHGFSSEEYVSYVLQFKSVKDAYRCTSALDDSSNLPDGIQSYRTNEDLMAFCQFYPYFEFVRNIVVVVVIILLLLVFLNILRVMDYSLSMNVDFFSMMSYLGLENKDIRRIYLIRNTWNYLLAVCMAFVLIVPSDIVISVCLRRIYTSQFHGVLDFNVPFLYYLGSAILPVLVIYGLVWLSSISILQRYTSLFHRKKVN